MPREGGGWLGSGATALMEKEDRCQERKHDQLKPNFQDLFDDRPGLVPWYQYNSTGSATRAKYLYRTVLVLVLVPGLVKG